MIRRGAQFLAEGTVVAIDPKADETVVTVETDEPVNTKMSGAAWGYEEVARKPVLRTVHVHVPAAKWRELVDDAGGQDMILARRVVIDDLGGRIA